MVLRFWDSLPHDVDWHTVIDDFGNVLKPFDSLSRKAGATWWNAYRFANGQSFEQAGMRSIGAIVEEH